MMKIRSVRRLFLALMLVSNGFHTVQAQVIELSPDRNVAVIHTHYLQNLNRMLTRPWLYRPVSRHVATVTPDWLELITIESLDPAGPVSLSTQPVIRIPASAP